MIECVVGMVLRRCVKLVFVRQKEVQTSEVRVNNVSDAFGENLTLLIFPVQVSEVRVNNVSVAFDKGKAISDFDRRKSHLPLVSIRPVDLTSQKNPETGNIMVPPPKD